MRQDNQEKFSDLAYDLHQVQTSGGMRPYVLFLGGASSKVEGQVFLDMLRRRVLLEPRRKRFTSDEIDKMEQAIQVEHFTQKWSELSRDLRLSLLTELQRKTQPTPGYNKLAVLLKEHYFPLVLTTTLDQLIEATFINYMMQNGQAPPPWKTLVNSATDAKEPVNLMPRFIQPALSTMTVLKLCGSINMESFAVTRGEVDEKIKAITEYLVDLSQYNLVVVSATPLDEIVLQHILQEINKSRNAREMDIYYINTMQPSSAMERCLKWHETTYIIEEEIDFDSALEMLVQQFNIIHKVETIGGAPLDQTNFERLRNQQSPTTEQTVAGYLKNSMPQRSNTGTLEPLAPSPSAPSKPTPQQTPTSPVAPPVAPKAPPADKPLVEVYEDEPFEPEPLIQPLEPEPLIQVLEPEEDKLIQVLRDTTLITVTLRADQRATFTVKDRTYYNFSSSQESDKLKFNLSDLNKEMRYMGEQIAAFHRLSLVKNLREGWRAQAKQMGLNLYHSIFQPIPELESMLEVTRGTAAGEDPANVTLVFSGPRQYLSMPYELLYYRNLPLIVQHPICRQVSGVNVRGEHFDDFFRNLRKRKQALRILLIASGTPGTTSDEQVLELEALIGQTIQERFGSKPVIDKLLTKQASIKAVRDRLRHCRHHIVHYAGHGTFDEASGENSGLTFFQRENMSGERVTLTAREIASLLTPSETRLFYINACVGAETSSDHVLYGSDYLGIMDGLVQAKVPYVLGFRWYVTDRGSRRFASLFYQNLFRRPLVPEQAVLQVRKQIFEEDPTDETWTSPILVAQTPYQ